jgi:hypothetical protein
MGGMHARSSAMKIQHEMCGGKVSLRLTRKQASLGVHSITKIKKRNKEKEAKNSAKMSAERPQKSRARRTAVLMLIA